MATEPLKCPECGAGFQWAGSNPHYNRARHIESAHLGGGHWSYQRTTKGTFENVPPAHVGTSPREDVNESSRFNKKHQSFFEDEGEEAIRRAGRKSNTESSHRMFNRPQHADTRTTEQKLEAMAASGSGASEGERANAQHLLFKRRQARGET